MRYYFFQTIMADRGNGPQPTMRALPGQTFDDGSDVDVNLNVHAPKEPGSSNNGSRLDYPTGTNFCSSYLEKVVTKNGKEYYTVYNTDQTLLVKDPDFHPVSDDPNFNYVASSHKNDKMNIAFVKFMNFGVQETNDEIKPHKKMAKNTKKEPSGISGPSDINGKAKQPLAVYEPKYEDQIKVETDHIVWWMNKYLNDNGIRNVAKKPRNNDETINQVTDLYCGGESIDTICSRSRLEDICIAQKVDAIGLTNIASGPLNWYLQMLIREHENQSDCSARARSVNNQYEVNDVVAIICREMDNRNGTTTSPSSEPTLIPNITKAIEMGWTLDDILQPDILSRKDNATELASDIANGIIPAPKKNTRMKTLFDSIMDDPKLKCPEANKGFHVDKPVWLLLMRNLKVKQNTILVGPSGSGKTELVKKACEVTNTPLTIIQMGGITDVSEHLVGKMDLDPATHGTKFDWAEFAMAIQRPGVILLDEINRIPRGGANLLYSVLDNNRTLHAPGAKSTDNREIKVNPDCCFIATANIGVENTDANEIDDALRTRLTSWITLDFMDIKTEMEVLAARTGIDRDDALAIAEVAKDIRLAYRKGSLQYNVSMRESLYTAELVRDGLSVEDAIEFGFLVHYEKGITENDPMSEYGQAKALIATHFNNKKN